MAFFSPDSNFKLAAVGRSFSEGSKMGTDDDDDVFITEPVWRFFNVLFPTTYHNHFLWDPVGALTGSSLLHRILGGRLFGFLKRRRLNTAERRDGCCSTCLLAVIKLFTTGKDSLTIFTFFA